MKRACKWLLWAVLLVACWREAATTCGNPDCWNCPYVDTYALVRLKDELCSDTDLQYVVPSNSVHFTVEPQSGVYQESKYESNPIFLHCNVTGVSGPTQHEFVWEHNDTVVTAGSTYTVIGDGQTHSSLKISGFSQDTQGEYLCRVKNGNFTLVSRVAHLEIPKFHNWIDEAYPPHPGSDHVSIQAHNGATVLLECQANTTDQVSKVVWYRNGSTVVDINHISLKNHYILPSGCLLVRDISLTPSNDLMYECEVVLAQPSAVKARNFTISLPNEGAPEAEQASVRPFVQKEALTGSSVELYCLPGFQDSQPEVMWSKDGTALDKLADSSSVKTLGKGVVLWIKNVSMETAGSYTCVVPSGNVSENFTSHVVVVEPPTSASVSLSYIEGGGGYVYGADVFIPVDRGNLTFHLMCSIDSSDSGANQEYRWFFQGNPVASPLFTQDGNTLIVKAPSAWDVVGSLQCFVGNLAGSTDTSVRVLIKDKPNPPINVDLTRDNEFVYQFELNWDAPASVANQTLTQYTIEVLVPSYNTVCSCCLSSGQSLTSFLANDYPVPNTHLYFVLASNTLSGESDFVCLKETIGFVSPPQPCLSDPAQVEDKASHAWNVTLHWNPSKDDCEYPMENTRTWIGIKCPLQNLISIEEVPTGHGSGSYDISIPCCSICEWSVTFRPFGGDEEHTTSQNSSLHTGSLVPSQPPSLEFVDRKSSDGKSITASIMIPDISISCIPRYLLIKYANESGIAGMENVTFGSYSPAKNLYNKSVVLQNAQCWLQYNISIAYGNARGPSEFSRNYTLRGPREGDVKGYASVTPKVVNSTAISVHLEPDEGIDCLLSMGFISGSVCYAKDECGENYVCSNCFPLADNVHDVTFADLHPFKSYCFTAEVLYTRVNGTTASIKSNRKCAQTNQGVPSQRPLDMEAGTVKDGDIEYIIITWKPPSIETRNGILTQYSITVAISNGTKINHKSSNTTLTWKTPPIQPYLKCEVTVSACTSVGCGPAANRTIDGSTTPPTTETDSTEPTSGTDSTQVIEIIVPVAIVAIVAIVVALFAVLKCHCRKRNVETQEVAGRDQNHRQREQQDQEDQAPNIAELPVLRDDRVTHVDLISVGNPAPSILTDRTDCLPLMHKYLKDCEDYSAPDGEVDNSFPTESHSDSVSTANSSPDDRLLHIPSSRGKIVELNYPKSKMRGTKGASENVELESFPPQYDMADLIDEQDSDENKPLLIPSPPDRHPSRKAGSSEGWRGLLSLGRRDKPELQVPQCQPSSVRTPPLGKPPSPREPCAPNLLPRITAVGGYLSEDTLRATSVHAAPATPVTALNHSRVFQSPGSGLPYLASENAAWSSMVTSSNPKQNEPFLQGIKSHSHIPPLEAAAICPSLPTATPRKPSNVHSLTGMNASGYVGEGATPQAVDDVTAFVRKVPATSRKYSEPTPQRKDLGYVQNDGSVSAHWREESRPWLHGEVTGDALELEAGSDTESEGSLQSSVFGGSPPVVGGYCSLPPPISLASRHTQRNRSEMTSGVFSQSDSHEPVSMSENFSAFCDTADSSGTKMSMSGSGRKQSEGYASEPATPQGQNLANFVFQQTADNPQSKVPAGYVFGPSAADRHTGKGMEMQGEELGQASVPPGDQTPQYLVSDPLAASDAKLAFQSGQSLVQSTGHTRELPAPRQSFVTQQGVASQKGRRSSYIPSLPASLESSEHQLNDGPRYQKPSGPSMVTWLYSGSTSSSEEFTSDDRFSLTGYSRSETIPPFPVTSTEFHMPHSRVSSPVSSPVPSGPSLSSGYVGSSTDSAAARFTSSNLAPGAAHTVQHTTQVQPTEASQYLCDSTLENENSNEHSVAAYVSTTKPAGPRSKLPNKSQPASPSSASAQVLSAPYTLPSLLVSPSQVGSPSSSILHSQGISTATASLSTKEMQGIQPPDCTFPLELAHHPITASLPQSAIVTSAPTPSGYV